MLNQELTHQGGHDFPRLIQQVVRTTSVQPRALRTAIKNGILERVTRGTYISTQADDVVAKQLTMIARCLTIDADSDKLVISHETAAVLRGLASPSLDVHVTHQVRRSADRLAGVKYHHRPGPIPAGPVGPFKRVATIERIVVDCALDLHPAASIIVIDSALRALVGGNRQERDALAAQAGLWIRRWRKDLDERGKVPHVRRARAILELGTPLAESAPESALRFWVQSAGYWVVSQFEVATAIGPRFPDLAIVDDRGRPVLFLEYDGREKYQNPFETNRQDNRDAAIVAATGVEILRVTKDDLRDHRELLERVQLLVPRAVALAAEPMVAFMSARRIRAELAS